MILPNKKDAIHRVWLYRILSAIYDNSFLANILYFKGGTAATMRGFLDRFSVDLDFDFIGDDKDILTIRKELEKIFKDLELEIKDQSKIIPQYFLKYPNKDGERNTIKIDVATFKIKANKYEQTRLIDIDRIATCQTIETMFANKLVAIIDRYEQHNTIAGRDLYDIHYFFMEGFGYEKDVVKERRGVSVEKFLNELISFIDKKITNTVIDQDLNTLLSPEKFMRIRNILKKETLMFLKNEL
ncbi:MAG: nucleotidyl transferase AbiEii/AbiGii toxin family protein [Candidatus Paceibacteria bacterium]